MNRDDSDSLTGIRRAAEFSGALHIGSVRSARTWLRESKRRVAAQPALKKLFRRYSLTSLSTTRKDLPTRTAGNSPLCSRR